MPQENEIPRAAIGRIKALAELLNGTDLVRLRVERGGEAIELRRSPGRSPAADGHQQAVPIASNGASKSVETITSDLVGIFHLSRPAPREGERLDGDRELASVEALGIRNPVRSLGSGRIVTIRCRDGEPVEYGQPLFEVERG